MECQTSVVKINSKKLDGKMFSSMMQSANENISKYYHIANRINVFPVPDKDTGTNVYHTINKSLEKIPHNEIFLPAYCSSLLENMEYFSLGNSGKIFSLFFTNSFKSWIKDNKIFVDVNELENALVNGIKNTWNYLDSIGFNPRKASILSVIGDSLKNLPASSLIEWVNSHYHKLIEEVWKTKEDADYLAKEKVVDSGALMYFYLIEGWNGFLQGKEIHYSGFDDLQRNTADVATQIYDVQFRLSKDNTDIKKIVDIMNKYGDQVIVLENPEFLNCHVHIINSEKVETMMKSISLLCKILTISVEDMSKVQTHQVIENILTLNNMKNPFIFYTGGADISRVLPGKYEFVRKISGKVLCKGNEIEHGERPYQEIIEMVEKGISFNTSQPSVNECKQAMQKAIDSGYDGLILIPLIRRIHCYKQAVKDLEIENKIQYVFTGLEDRQANLLSALAIAEDIKEKKSPQDALLNAFKRIKLLKVYEIGPTGFFLSSNRINALEHNLGKIFWSPIIKTYAGETKLIGGISSKDKLEKELLDLIEKDLPNTNNIDVLIAYGKREDLALRLKNAFAKKFSSRLRLNFVFMKGGSSAVRGEDSYCTVVVGEH